MKKFSLKALLAKFGRRKESYADKTSIAATEIEADAEPIPGIPGVDMEKGLSYIAGDRDLYEQLLLTYTEGWQERIEKLNKYKEEKDIKSYEISIHGLKSVSASIGATEFAKVAENLEKACMDEEKAIEYISANHDYMVEEYKAIIDGIKKWLAVKKTYGKIEKEKVLDLTNLLTKFVHMKKAIYEYRKMDACGYLEELLETEVPIAGSSMGAEKYNEALQSIYKLVSDYDMNEAYEAAEKLEDDIRRLL